MILNISSMNVSYLRVYVDLLHILWMNLVVKRWTIQFVLMQRALVQTQRCNVFGQTVLSVKETTHWNSITMAIKQHFPYNRWFLGFSLSFLAQYLHHSYISAILDIQKERWDEPRWDIQNEGTIAKKKGQ